MTRSWHCCVLIPAHNEEELLPRCLASVKLACAQLPPHVTYDIVVAVDASTDETGSIAEKLLHSFGAVVHTSQGVVGSARAAAAKAALERYQGSPACCWLAHTDADCIVPKDWLLNQLTLADMGTEAVAGVISVDSFREHSMHVEARFLQTYVINPDGGHAHVHGANLGIRADVYLRAGEWAELPTAEDHDLWNRVRRVSSSVISTAQLKVTTSGRRTGRAPNGFAQALAAHNEAVA